MLQSQIDEEESKKLRSNSDINARFRGKLRKRCKYVLVYCDEN